MVEFELEQLVKEYISDVNRACDIMLSSLKLGSKEDLIKYRQNHSSGEFYLNGNNEYTFHGRGCRFSNNDLCIDWDFGYGDNWCGIEPWKLACYIKDNKIINEPYDGAKIKEIFDELIIKGKMIKKYDLYYFK